MDYTHKNRHKIKPYRRLFQAKTSALPVNYDISDEIDRSTMRVSAGAALVVDKGIILSDKLLNGITQKTRQSILPRFSF